LPHLQAEHLGQLIKAVPDIVGLRQFVPLRPTDLHQYLRLRRRYCIPGRCANGPTLGLLPRKPLGSYFVLRFASSIRQTCRLRIQRRPITRRYKNCGISRSGRKSRSGVPRNGTAPWRGWWRRSSTGWRCRWAGSP